MTQIVIPGADEFGARVNHRTPLAKVIAVLRRHNPEADYKTLRVAGESLRRYGHPAPDGASLTDDERAAAEHRVDAQRALPEHEPTAEQLAQIDGDAEVSREPGPDRLDSGTGSDVDNSAPVSSPSEPEVGKRKPTRAEVEAWIATLPPRRRPQMSKSGRIPAAVLVAYRAAHRDEVLASMVPVEGGEPMPAEVPPEEVH